MAHKLAIPAELGPGSFKDPDVRVIVHRGEVYRTLTRDASRRMLRNRADVFPYYGWAHFERLLRERFSLAEMAESHGGTRKLCLLLPRA